MGFTRYDLRITKVKEKHLPPIFHLGQAGQEEEEAAISMTKNKLTFMLAWAMRGKKGSRALWRWKLSNSKHELTLQSSSIELNYYSEFEIPLALASRPVQHNITTLHSIPCCVRLCLIIFRPCVKYYIFPRCVSVSLMVGLFKHLQLHYIYIK